MKQRAIYQEIWKDETFANLSPQAKILSLYLLTNHNIKLIRAYELPSEREICFDTGISKKDLPKLKEEIQHIGIYCLNNHCILKTRFAVFKYKGGKLGIAIDQQLRSLPENVLQSLESDTLSIGYQYPTDTTNDNDNDNDSIVSRDGGVGEEVKKVFENFQKKINQNANLTNTAKEKINTRLKIYSLDKLLEAIEKFSKNKWRMENNSDKSASWFFRSDEQIETFLCLKNTTSTQELGKFSRDNSLYNSILQKKT